MNWKTMTQSVLYLPSMAARLVNIAKKANCLMSTKGIAHGADYHTFRIYESCKNRSLKSIYYRSESVSSQDGHQRYIPSHEQRINKVLDAFERLTPHDSSEISTDIPQGNYEQMPLKSNYASFTRLKPLIVQTLTEQAELVADNDKTVNTIEVINLFHSDVGLGIRAIVKLLTRCKSLFEVDINTLTKRIDNLRSYHLRNVALQKAITQTPEYLLVSVPDIISMMAFLVGDLDFTTKELPELFLFAPSVILDPPEITEEKFQYLYFTMGHKLQHILVKHGVMRYSLQHIRSRHLFLDRRGQYQLADKKRSVTIQNPKIRQMICSTDAFFCKEVAVCRPEEYKLFKSVLKAEDELRDASHSQTEEITNKHEFADKLLEEMS